MTKYWYVTSSDEYRYSGDNVMFLSLRDTAAACIALPFFSHGINIFVLNEIRLTLSEIITHLAHSLQYFHNLLST